MKATCMENRIRNGGKEKTKILTEKQEKIGN